jgi:hypothetical protein
MLLNEVPWAALFWVLYANGVLLVFVSLYIYEYFERQFYKDATKLLEATDMVEADVIDYLKRDLSTYRELCDE